MEPHKTLSNYSLKEKEQSWKDHATGYHTIPHSHSNQNGITYTNETEYRAHK